MITGLETRTAIESINDAPASDFLSKVYPKISLPEEHKRQGLILARLYRERLGFESDAAYMATLPDFPEKPANYNTLGLNIPLIIETRIPWMEAAELSGIYIGSYLRGRANAGKVGGWQDDKVDVSKVPFTAWAQDGTKFISRTPSDVNTELVTVEQYKQNYMAGKILAMIAIFNVRLDIGRAMNWNVVGNKVGIGSTPCLGPGDSEPHKFSVNLIDVAYPDYRALVHGREIRILNLTA